MKLIIDLENDNIESLYTAIQMINHKLLNSGDDNEDNN
jgi:hypothetical protein